MHSLLWVPSPKTGGVAGGWGSPPGGSKFFSRHLGSGLVCMCEAGHTNILGSKGIPRITRGRRLMVAPWFVGTMLQEHRNVLV